MQSKPFKVEYVDVALPPSTKDSPSGPPNSSSQPVHPFPQEYSMVIEDINENVHAIRKNINMNVI